MRAVLDKIFRAAIKLCMLTGVTFLVTACYGTPNPPDLDEYHRDHQQMKENLQKFRGEAPQTATTDEAE